MKKIVCAIFLLGLAVCVLAQTTEQGSGLIRELSGTVELRNVGATDFVPARAGDRVNEDTIISTGFRSTALVEVGSTLITVRPLTRLSLTEISAAQGTETLDVAMQTGRVRVDVNPPAGGRASMTVTSPNVTASVRGTSFYFDTRNITVNEGVVSFKGSRGHTFQIGAGSSGSVGSRDTASSTQGTVSSRPPSPVGFDTTTRTTGASSPISSVGPGEPDTPGTGGGEVGVDY
jgi:hypothetical protein